MQKRRVAEFIVPDWGNKVNYGMHGVVIPARQATSAASGPERQPYAGVDYVPQ